MGLPGTWHCRLEVTLLGVVRVGYPHLVVAVLGLVVQRLGVLWGLALRRPLALLSPEPLGLAHVRLVRMFLRGLA